MGSKTRIDYLEKIVLSALEEDIGEVDDITSLGTINKEQISKFELIVNQDAVLAGLDVFKKAFEVIDKNIIISEFASDGDFVKSKTSILEISGNTISVLKGERAALNFLGHLSGIATTTNKIVALIKGTGAQLLDTRKTTPGLRVLEKKAVLLGGGKNHRLNLSEMILIKDNHIAASGGVRNAIENVRGLYKNKYKIEVEVQNPDELSEAISLKPDVIMFDNWSIQDLKKHIVLVPKEIVTEVSGQISLENIREYAEVGINYISTSYMVKNSSWVDFSLEVKLANGMSQ